jgi:teichuronic acid biosynthesis glycosyltransferase TuaC
MAEQRNPAAVSAGASFSAAPGSGTKNGGLQQARPYKILVVTNLWPTTEDPGYGSFVEAQMESLRPLGVEYDVVFINGRKSVWNYVRGIGEMRSRLRRQCYDLIHAHFGLSGWVARCQLRRPVVVSFMGDDVLGRPGRGGAMTWAGRFFQMSSFVLARVVRAVIVKTPEMKARLALGTAHVIPNGVDLQLFQPIDQVSARRELGLDISKKFILFPYNPAEVRKRYDLVEAAAKLARREIPELEILPVRGVARRRMPLYMNAADLLVLASLWEGSPNAVKEAMAVNLPVVAVDVGDVAELIGPTEGCYLVPPDTREIAARIVEVCRRGRRTRGREWIARLSIESVARQVVNVYASCMRK